MNSLPYQKDPSAYLGHSEAVSGYGERRNHALYQDAIANPYGGVHNTYLESGALKLEQGKTNLNLDWRPEAQQKRHQLGSFLYGLSKVPFVGDHISDSYLKICIAKNEGEANRYFADMKRRLYLGTDWNTRWWMLNDDISMEHFIEARLKEVNRLIRTKDMFQTFFTLSGVCARYFEPYPAINERLENKLGKSGDAYMPGAFYRGIPSAQARMLDAAWWSKRIRTIQARTLEQICRETAAVCKRRAAYSSDYAVNNWQQQQRKNTDLLEKLVMVDENDDENFFTLLELANKSVSNPELRRNELMTRIRGFEEIAVDEGHQGLFITVTTPSRFHSATIHGQPNKKHDGSTPRDAQAWLSDNWARCRALFKHYETQPYGFRIAEPHHDGCPHWHLLLFVPVGKVGALKHCFKTAFMKDEIEQGTEQHRLKVVDIDRNRGSAAGYIAKYIAKNIDGSRIDKDKQTNQKAKDAALRVRSWASTWGIRQFQQIGGPSVQIWREMRRFREPFQEGHKMVESLNELERAALEAVRRAADAGDWKAFCLAMGGVNIVRKDRSIKLSYQVPQIINKMSGELEQKKGRYGDVQALRVVGIVLNQAFLATRHVNWELRHKKEFIQSTGQIMDGVSNYFDIMEQYDLYVAQCEYEYDRLEKMWKEDTENMWLAIDEEEALLHEFLLAD